MRALTHKLYKIAGLVSEQIWGRLPGSWQRAWSKLCGRLFATKISRLLITPYCWWHYNDPRHHQRFRPGYGASSYRTFQDFFTRDFVSPPDLRADTVWPCEGYLCDKGRIDDLSKVKVKGSYRDVRSIFHDEADAIPGDGYFSNVFLHNKNYHHIHAPTGGRVKWVKRIAGELLLLRPWAYAGRPSVPAFTNERLNVALVDEKGRDWFLSIIGGPVVGSIVENECLKVGARIKAGQKLATFELGSTCCMVSPLEPDAVPGHEVFVGLGLNEEPQSQKALEDFQVLRSHG